MCEVVSQISEIACSEIASAAIEDISKKTKISPFHLAINVDGLVHDHPPCEYNVETCAYCKRNGNIFAKDGSQHTMTVDVISKYKKKVAVVLEEMFREITNVVYDKAFDNDDSEIESNDETNEEQDEELMLEKMLSHAFGDPR